MIYGCICLFFSISFFFCVYFFLYCLWFLNTYNNKKEEKKTNRNIVIYRSLLFWYAFAIVLQLTIMKCTQEVFGVSDILYIKFDQRDVDKKSFYFFYRLLDLLMLKKSFVWGMIELFYLLNLSWCTFKWHTWENINLMSHMTKILIHHVYRKHWSIFLISIYKRHDPKKWFSFL